MRKLMRDARDNPSTSLYQFNERQLDNAVRTIGARCHHRTKQALRESMGRPFKDWPDFGLIGRIELDTETDRVSYTAGQDYTAELPVLRELLLKY
jgi:hypothetical protein